MTNLPRNKSVSLISLIIIIIIINPSPICLETSLISLDVFFNFVFWLLHQRLAHRNSLMKLHVAYVRFIEQFSMNISKCNCTANPTVMAIKTEYLGHYRSWSSTSELQFTFSTRGLKKNELDCYQAFFLLNGIIKLLFLWNIKVWLRCCCYKR